jgi:hypothetical protein
VALAQENWPLELVPAVGIEPRAIVVIGHLYHRKKNDVKE